MPPEYDYSGAVVCMSQIVHADQIPFMAMSSRERSQCATSFKGRLVTYIADVRVMSALAPKSRHRSARGACPLCWSLASKEKRPCRGKTRRLLSQHSGRVAPDERDGSPLWCS